MTLEVRSVSFSPREVVVTLEATSPTRRCPTCQHPSDRPHSRYWRRLADLPIRQLPVTLRIRARRFVCRTPSCKRKVFAERLGDVARVAARRTQRLREDLRAIGMADGGEKGARLAQRLGMVTSPDSLLRLIREAAPVPPVNPRVIGVDDWAKRKGRTYGAIIVDLERHQVVDLLEEATAEEFATWLRAHPGVEVISRDRGGEFAEGGREGAPNAIQVADRFHLLKNLGDAVEEYLRRIHRQLPPKSLPPTAPSAHDVAAVEPARPSRHEEDRLRRRARRLERYQAAIVLHQKGVSARQIAHSLGLDRQTVAKYLHADGFPEMSPRTKRPSLLDPFRGYLQHRWDEGCHNAIRLFRELQDQGFPGQRSIVVDAVAKLRSRWSPEESAQIAHVVEAAPTRRTSPRQVRWWFQRKPEDLEDEGRVALTHFLAEHAEARVVYELTQRFGQIIRERRRDELDGWLEDARRGPRELRSLARGIQRDRPAVEAGLIYEWSQGQTEGQVNRVKLTKRAMFGRANFDLLRQRVLAAA